MCAHGWVALMCESEPPGTWPILCSSIVSFWITLTNFKEHKYHIFWQYLYTRYVVQCSPILGCSCFWGPTCKVYFSKMPIISCVCSMYNVANNKSYGLVLWVYVDVCTVCRHVIECHEHLHMLVNLMSISLHGCYVTYLHDGSEIFRE